MALSSSLAPSAKSLMMVKARFTVESFMLGTSIMYTVSSKAV